jgi:hypothetical protein
VVDAMVGGPERPMLVTGVQAVGSKGVTAVQGTVVDTSESTRTGLDADPDAKRASGGRTRPGDPQPVVFPRKGLPVDSRPVALRKARAVIRYRSDGGDHDTAA